MIKSRQMRWAGHVVYMRGEEECMPGSGGETRRKETIRMTKCRRNHDIKIILEE
jgi:hypothetical protein